MADFDCRLRTSPDSIASVFVSLDASKGKTLVGGAGSAVSKWENQRGSVHATNGSGTGPTDSAGFGGNPALAFNGATQWLEMLLSHAASNYTAIFVLDPASAAVGDRRLLSAGASPLYLGYTGSTASVTGWNDGSWKEGSSPDLEPQVLSYVLDQGAGGRLRRNGFDIVAGAYTQKALATIGLGAAHGGGSNWFNGAIARILIADQALSNFELASVEGLLGQRYGIATPHATRSQLVTFEDWTDPVGPAGQPSRVNWLPGIAQRFYRMTAGRAQVAAVVNGVEGPSDAALGGRLFTAYFVEHASSWTPGVYQGDAQSSVADFELPVPGHYTLAMRRAAGGAVFIHLDVQ